MKKGYSIELMNKTVETGVSTKPCYLCGVNVFSECGNDIKVEDGKPRILVWLAEFRSDDMPNDESAAILLFKEKETAEKYIDTCKAFQQYETKFVGEPPEGYKMTFKIVEIEAHDDEVYQEDLLKGKTIDYFRDGFFEKMDKCWAYLSENYDYE